MPVIASPSHQAWVRVPTPRRKTPKVSPAEAFRGPLSYLSCRPLDPKPIIKAINQPWPIYDDDLPPRPGIRNKKSSRSAHRVVSAPPVVEENRSSSNSDVEQDQEEDRYGDEEDQYQDPEEASPPSQLDRPRRYASNSRVETSHHAKRPPPHAESHTRSQHRHSSAHYPPSQPSTSQPSWHRPQANHYHRSSAATPGRNRWPNTGHSRPISSAWSSATQPLDLG